MIALTTIVCMILLSLGVAVAVIGITDEDVFWWTPILGFVIVIGTIIGIIVISPEIDELNVKERQLSEICRGQGGEYVNGKCFKDAKEVQLEDV